jgi:opacity protein-like surface antigen
MRFWKIGDCVWDGTVRSLIFILTNRISVPANHKDLDYLFSWSYRRHNYFFQREVSVSNIKYKVAAAWVFLFVFCLIAHARAEQVLKLFVGGAFTQDHDVKDRFEGIGNFVLKSPDFDNSISLGAGFAHWFGAIPYLGLGLDVVHFRPDISKQSGTACELGLCLPDTFVSRHFQVTGITLDLLGRLPLLVSKEYPQGKLQPYASAGPTLFISRVNMAGGHFVPGAPTLRNQHDTDAAVGVTAAAGLSFMISPHVDLFTEYRFTHFSPSYRITSGGERAKVTTDFDTHHVLVGASYHFCAFGC